MNTRFQSNPREGEEEKRRGREEEKRKRSGREEEEEKRKRTGEEEKKRGTEEEEKKRKRRGEEEEKRRVHVDKGGNTEKVGLLASQLRVQSTEPRTATVADSPYLN